MLKIPSTFEDMKRNIESNWEHVIWSESYGIQDTAVLIAWAYLGCAAEYLGARLETLKDKIGNDLINNVLGFGGVDIYTYSLT